MDTARAEVPKRRWRRWAKRFAWAFTILIVVAVGAFFVWGWRAKTARDAEIAKIRERGEPVWFHELRPDPLPSEVDGTPALLAAFDALVSYEDYEPDEPDENWSRWIDYDEYSSDLDALVTLARMSPHIARATDAGRERPKRASSATNPGNMDDDDIDDADDELPPLDADAVFKVLEEVTAKNKKSFRLIEAAIQKGQCQFPVDYDAIVAMDAVPSYASSEGSVELARSLVARGILELRDGNGSQAVATANQIFDLAEITVTHRIGVMGILVRLVIDAHAILLVEHVLAQHELTPEEFAEIDQRLARIDETYRLAPALIAERAMSISTMEQLASMNLNDPLERGTRPRWYLRPWIHVNQTTTMQWMNRWIAIVDRTDEEGTDELKAVESDINDTTKYIPWCYGPSIMLQPSVDQLRHVVLYTRQRAVHLRLALRVAGHHHRRGMLPKSLDEILDDAIPEIPLGLLSRKPPVYRTSAGKFEIYSLGTDGVDGGGHPSRDVIDPNARYDPTLDTDEVSTHIRVYVGSTIARPAVAGAAEQ